MVDVVSAVASFAIFGLLVTGDHGDEKPPAGLVLSALTPGVVFAASAIYGYDTRNKCRRYQEKARSLGPTGSEPGR